MGMTDTKFQIITTPEADATFDALTAENAEATVKFIFEVMPNIRRRDALTKNNLPIGTLFNFRVPETNVVLTTVYGKTDVEERVLVVLAAFEVE